MNTQIYFQFKQWFDTKEGKKLGNTIALSNMTFPDPDTALKYLQEQIESVNILEDDVQEWELVRVIQDVIPNAISKYTFLPNE